MTKANGVRNVVISLQPEGPRLPLSRERKGNPLGDSRSSGSATLRFLMWVGLYYGSNSFVVLTNKQLISQMGFQFPILLTCMHMTSTIFFSYLMMDVYQVLKKEHLASAGQRRHIGLLAAMFAVSLMCGNWSFRYASVAFAQMIGASTPFFVSVLGFIFFGTVFRWQVYATLFPIVGGAMISTYGELNLTILGLFFQLAATFTRGLKTVWQGHLLQGEEKLNSPNLLRYMAMDAAAILAVLSLLFESKSFITWLRSDEEGDGNYRRWYFFLLLLFNPMSAYMANMSQFMLIQMSNPLTFQVIGNTKGLLNVFFDILFFGTQVSGLAALGYSITLTGVALYSRERRRS